MLSKNIVWGMLLMIGVSLLGSVTVAEYAEACKVLVVISFEEEFFWSKEVKQGVNEVLREHCEFTYAYLDAEVNPGEAKAKADEAYALYQEWQPDGVIAEGDDAQVYFVLPYLKDKTTTPVIFAEIYADPQTLGFPASNVSGVPARPRFQESLNFVRQLVPSIKTVGILLNDFEVARAATPFVKKAFEELSVTVLEPFLSNDAEEIVQWVERNKSECDAIFTAPAIGEQNVKNVVKAFEKPTFTVWGEGVRYGILAAVTESGVEVGRLAAEMLQEAMDGKPIAELPFRYVEFGHRIINVNTVKTLGLKPSRRLLTGVELIRE